MKKILVLCIFCSLLSTAYCGIDSGIDKGMTYAGVLFGVGAPTSKYSNMQTVTDDYPEPGSAGATYGAQIIHHVSPYLGLGFEFTGTNFTNAEYSASIGSDTVMEKFSADLYKFMIAAKVAFAPSAATRFYVPLGVGFANFTQKAKVDSSDPSFELDESESCTKPAFYLGLGLENDLNDWLVLGFEARYNGWFLDSNKFDDNSYLDSVDLLIKLSVKF